MFLKTFTATMSNQYLSMVIVPATLSYQTDWARVEVTSPGVSFRKDEALAGYAFYDNVTFTTTSVMFSKPHSEVFGSGVVPYGPSKGFERPKLMYHTGSSS